MPKEWVINASPIISLAHINMASLILELPDALYIPSGVIEEINCGPMNDPAKSWLQKHGNGKSVSVGQISHIVSAWDLGKGETEVIHWAYAHPGAIAILDDRAARNCASALGISVIGTIGIILSAKRENKIERVKPLLLQLDQNGFHISPGLLAAAILVSCRFKVL